MSTGDRDSYDVLAVQVGMAKRALCGDVDAKHDDFRRECERAPLKNRVVEAARTVAEARECDGISEVCVAIDNGLDAALTALDELDT